MGYRVREFQETPNPGAIKCVLDRAVTPLERAGDKPRSYRSAPAVSEDPLAARLFGVAGVTNVLIGSEWITIGKAADASWKSVKSGAEKALADAE